MQRHEVDERQIMVSLWWGGRGWEDGRRQLRSLFLVFDRKHLSFFLSLPDFVTIFFFFVVYPLPLTSSPSLNLLPIPYQHYSFTHPPSHPPTLVSCRLLDAGDQQLEWVEWVCCQLQELSLCQVLVEESQAERGDEGRVLSECWELCPFAADCRR